MTWRVGKISGGTGGTWRIAGLSGTVSHAPVTTWQVASISGTIKSGWKIAKLSGTVAQVLVPVVAAFGTKIVDPVSQVTITGLTSNGVSPDSWSFSSTDVALTVSGNTATFSTPGTSTGTTVSVTVTATKNGNVSAPVTASFIVTAAYIFYQGTDGQLHAVSYPYQK